MSEKVPDDLAAAIAEIVQRAAELNLPEYTRPEAAAKLLERRRATHGTLRAGLRSVLRTLDQKRRALNAEGERQATAKWNKRNRDEILERDAARRNAARQAIRMRRDSQPLTHRLQAALIRAQRLGGMRALTVDPNGGGRSAESTRIGPPNAESAAFDRFSRLLRAAVIGLERELDDLELGAIPENGPERDARIRRDYAGLDPAVVAAIDPTAGSPSTIRRARVAGGLDGRRGTRPARAEDAA